MRLPFANSWSRTLQQAWLTRGPLAVALLPLTAVFAVLNGVRTLLYQQGLLVSRKLGVPVVVVGNLIAGGAGKTPTVMALVALLRRHGYSPGILSRGYGRRGKRETIDIDTDTQAGECGDEPKLLHLRTAAPVMVGRNRVTAGAALLQSHPEVDVIVSDDGLQHLALARDAQVVVFDARGVGNGWLLPSGPLREPLRASVPPRTVVLYNAASASTPWPGSLGTSSLAGIVDLASWWQGRHASLGPLEALREKPLWAAAGIANPDRFFAMLREHGLLFESLPLPDHCSFDTLPWPASAADVLVTEKDAVKIDPGRVGVTRVWVAALDFRTSPAFEADLIALLPARRLRGIDHGSSPA